MSFEEQLCFVFDCGPSQLARHYWTNTFGDLKTRLRIRFGFEHARLIQGFENLALVGSQALGGGKKDGPRRGPPPGVKPIENEEDAMAAFMRVMG